MKRTTTEAELRKWNDEGLTRKEVAEILGYHVSVITSACAVLGLTPLKRTESLHDLERAGLAISQGVGLTDYCRQHGIPVPSLYQALRRAGRPTSAAEYLRRQAGAA